MMHALTAERLVRIWEQGLDETPEARALTLLSAASDAPTDDVAELDAVQRQHLLLQLHRRLMGDRLEVRSACPTCDADVEIVLQNAEGANVGLTPVKSYCPECAGIWRVTIDIGAIIWLEICRRAEQIMRDTATIAQRYGWSEQDILRMSAHRRRFYLEMEAPE